VECNTDEEPNVFKAQLYALTGVLPERQKVLIRYLKYVLCNSFREIEILIVMYIFNFLGDG